MFKSLALKLAATFLLITFIGTTVSIYISYQGLQKAVAEASLLDAKPIVESLVSDISEHVSTPNSYQSIYQLFLRFIKINPNLSPYLTDDNNTVILSPFRINHKSLKFFSDNKLVTNPKNSGELLNFILEKNIAGSNMNLLTVIERDTPIQITATQKLIFVQGLILFISTSIAVIIMSLLFASRVKRLRQSVLDFEAGKGFSAYETESNDEIGELSVAFQNMADRINRSVIELKERDALRRELIAGISHDLRTPLSAISGFTEVLLGEEQADLKREKLTTIHRNSQVLKKLIDGLFELARLDEVTENLELKPFPMAELVSDIVAKFMLLAESKNISLKLNPPDAIVEIVGDPSLIERAISNLIENAILYTDSGGRVEITISNESDRINISINDTGRGISPEDLDRIFLKFFRGDRSRDKETGGSGLGLAVTKRIIEAHGGSISVESILGKGTTFKLYLQSI